MDTQVKTRCLFDQLALAFSLSGWVFISMIPHLLEIWWKRVLALHTYRKTQIKNNKYIYGNSMRSGYNINKEINHMYICIYIYIYIYIYN